MNHFVHIWFVYIGKSHEKLDDFYNFLHLSTQLGVSINGWYFGVAPFMETHMNQSISLAPPGDPTDPTASQPSQPAWKI